MKLIDDLIEQLRLDFKELFSLIDSYCIKKYESAFSDSNRLNEDKKSQELEFCEKTVKLINRITKDIGSLESALDKNLKVLNIDEANSNLIDIAGKHEYLQLRFRQLHSKNKKLNNLYSLLREAIDSLNVRIQQYNKTSKDTLNTIQEALEIFKGNSPS